MRSRWIAHATLLLALVVIGSIPFAPAIFAGHYPNTQESIRYDILTLLFRDAITHGQLYPRWLPDLAGGMGYPTFVFYQPVFFYVATFCSWLPGVPLAGIAYVASFCFAIIGASGAYALARPIVASRGVALASATLFVLTPYFFVNLYVRGDHSEAAALMCSPWPIALLMAIERCQRDSRSIGTCGIAASISIGVVLATHPAFALVYIPMIALIASTRVFAFADRTARMRWLATLALIFIAGASLASPHWFSVMQHASSVHLDRVTSAQYRAELGLFPISRLLSNRWGFDWIDRPTTDTTAPLSVQLGLPLLLLSLAGAWFGRREPWVVPLAIAYALLIAAMTPIAAPFWRTSINPLRTIQFPWRLLGVIGVIQLVLISHALAALRRRTIVVWLLVAATAGWSYQMFSVSPDKPQQLADGSHTDWSWDEASRNVRQIRDNLVWSGIVFAAAREFDPIWSQRMPEPRGDGGMLLGRANIQYAADNSPYRIHASVTSPTPDGLIIQQLYFPGFEVWVEGVRIDDDSLRDNVFPDGRMIVPVPAGTSEVRAYYAGPPYATLRSVVAVAVSIAAVLGLRRLSR